MFVEISQRMFSEIMPAFTEMAEMFIMKTKNSEKRPYVNVFNEMLSWCVINRRQNRELEKHQEEKKLLLSMRRKMK